MVKYILVDHLPLIKESTTVHEHVHKWQSGP